MNRFKQSFLASLLVHGLFISLLFSAFVIKPFYPRAIPVDFLVVKDQKSQSPSGAATEKGGRVEPAAGRIVAETKEKPLTEEDTTRITAEQVQQKGTPAMAPVVTASGDVPTGTSSAHLPPAEGDGSAASPLHRFYAVSGRAGLAGLSEGAGARDKAGLREIIGAQLRELVERNKERAYPERAKRMGWEGKADIFLWIFEDGTIHDVRVTRSSGSQVLDEAARGLLSRIRLPRGPGERFDYSIAIDFSLK